MKNKSKRLPLGNGFIETSQAVMNFATQLTPLAYTWAEFHFQRYHNGPSDPKGNENIILTMVKYGEKFYDRPIALTPAAVL